MENEIKKYLKLHLGIIDNDIQKNIDDYKDEWIILGKPVEILPFKEARDNEVEDHMLGQVNIPYHWFDMFSDTKTLGRYIQLSDSDYYLRWL